MATTVSERETPPPAEPTAKQSNTMAWSILSALGGAGLLLVGQVALEEYKSARQDHEKGTERIQRQGDARVEQAERLFLEYENLGPQVESAGAYIRSGDGGSRGDLQAVVRHLRKVVALIFAERADPQMVVRLYGGRLTFWHEQLSALSMGTSSVTNQFSELERADYLRLALALRSLADPAASQVAPAHNIVMHNRIASVRTIAPLRTVAPPTRRLRRTTHAPDPPLTDGELVPAPIVDTHHWVFPMYPSRSIF